MTADQRQLEADYVIVGAGASAMAFADTLLSDSDADLIIVDRGEYPGGHWTGAYPFVRLHSPSLVYGVNSRELGRQRLDEVGFNRGLLELASGAEVSAYFDQLMRERFLPSGRVKYIPSHDYADGVATSITGGDAIKLDARKKLVDATFAGTQLPTTHPPSFSIADGVRCIPPHALISPPEPNASYVIIGAGKTAMDTIVWLQEQDVAPDRIAWIRPRDAWVLPRENMQPSYDFFAATIGALALEMEAARDAASFDDLFWRLEAAGVLRRLDETVTPSMYRCAIVSDAELQLLRKVRNVVRLGRVEAIARDHIRLQRGLLSMPPDAVHVNCSADGLPPRAPEPIFQPGVIKLQYVRRCSPTFSAAMIAHLQATIEGDAEKNALAEPIPPPGEPRDWLRMHVIEARNRYRWSQSPELGAWLVGARLDRFSAMIARAMHTGDPACSAILARYRAASQPALARLAQLLT